MRHETIGNIELTCEDCMDLMAKYPDKYFDLAIVDPPYGVGTVTYMPGERIHAFGGSFDKYEITVGVLDMNQRKKVKVDVVNKNNTYTTGLQFGDENVSPPPAYFKELFRVAKHQIIWGGNYFLLPPSRGFVIWSKPTVTENFSMAMCEFAWMSFNQNAKIFSCPPMGKPGERIHPTQKPVALYKWILSNYAKTGWKILDTHLGSGSHAVACYDMGFHLTACEIDDDYFTSAVKRLKLFTAQGKLDFGGEA